MRGVPACVQFYLTQDFPSFNSALRQFLTDSGAAPSSVSSCCLAVAGPVWANVCNMTNLDWVIHGDEIAEEFGFRTAVRGPCGGPFARARPRGRICLASIAHWPLGQVLAVLRA